MSRRGREGRRQWQARDGVDPTTLRVPQTHGRLTRLDEIVDQLQAYEGYPVPVAARGGRRPAAPGLDLDELQLAGRPVPLEVRVHGLPAERAARALVRVRVTAADRSPRDAVAAGRWLTWNTATGTFVGELPPLEPGFHDVAVTARAVPDAGDLEVQDTIAVADDADLG